MDSEKYLKLENQLEHGESPNDEGPFYHHSWWESYKGSIKGKLGGTVVGALMGTAVGAAVSLALTFTGIGAIAVGGTFVAMIGAGILYGVHEFGEIGKIVGSNAATQEQADAREAIRFSVIEKKLDALTNLVLGKRAGESASSPEVDTSRENEALVTYRKTHYAKLNGSSKGLVFWKIAAIGFAIGATAGILLALGPGAGIAGHILMDVLGIHLVGAELAYIPAISTLTFGMFGASFGINRDKIRKVFDVTDLWSKGFLTHEKVREHQEEAGKDVEKHYIKPNAQHQENKLEPEHPPSALESGTFHRDRLLTAANKDLLNLDHTSATRH